MPPEESNRPTETFPSTGDIITLRASDYFDGTNDMSLRLVHVPDELSRIPTLEWAQVIGVEVFSADACGPQRIFVVRVDALKAGPGKSLTTITETE